MKLEMAKQITSFLETEPFWKDYYSSLYNDEMHNCLHKMLTVISDRFLLEFNKKKSRSKYRPCYGKITLKGAKSKSGGVAVNHFYGTVSSGTFTGPAEGYPEINRAEGFHYDCETFNLSWLLYKVISESEPIAFYQILQREEDEMFDILYDEIDKVYSSYAVELLYLVTTLNEYADEEYEDCGFDIEEMIIGALYLYYLSGGTLSRKIKSQMKQRVNLRYFNGILTELMGFHYLQTGFKKREASDFFEEIKEFWPLIEIACETLFSGRVNEGGSTISCFCFSSHEIYEYVTHDRIHLSQEKQRIMDKLLAILTDPMRPDLHFSGNTEELFVVSNNVLSRTTKTACYAFSYYDDDFSIIPEASIASGLFHMLYHQWFKGKGVCVA